VREQKTPYRSLSIRLCMFAYLPVYIDDYRIFEYSCKAENKVSKTEILCTHISAFICITCKLSSWEFNYHLRILLAFPAIRLTAKNSVKRRVHKSTIVVSLIAIAYRIICSCITLNFRLSEKYCEHKQHILRMISYV